MSRRSRIVPVLVMTLLLLTAACGSKSKTAATTTTLSTAPQVSGSVTVFAGASLTEAFNKEKTTLTAANPGLTIIYSFGGSGALVTQIQQGAPADVIATADTATMKKLSDAGLVEAPVTFAKNRLEILVAPGNPKQIRGLTDLGRSDLKFVTEDETVPAGKYSAQALTAAGVKTSPVSRETDVKSAVAKVTSGEADATIVYVTDVKAAGAKGQGVNIPDAQNVVAEYPIAIVKATHNHAAATAFVDAMVKGSGQDALRTSGFLAPV